MHDDSILSACRLGGAVRGNTSIAGTRGVNRLLPRDGGGGRPLPYLVPQVDRDGNELGGLRLPEVTVPLSTYTGWNFRNDKIGGTEQQFALMGGYIPFASTKAEREQRHDPRLSIEERYQSREHYLKLVREAAAPLVKSGYLLADDVPTILQRARAITGTCWRNGRRAPRRGLRDRAE